MKLFFESKKGTLVSALLFTVFFFVLLYAQAKGRLGFSPTVQGVLLAAYGCLALILWFRWLTLGRAGGQSVLLAALALTVLTFFLPAAAVFGWILLDVFVCGILAGVCAALAVVCWGTWILNNRRK